MTPALRILATAILALALAGCDRSDAARAPAPPPASQPVDASASGHSDDVVSCPLDVPSSRIARIPVEDVHEIAAHYTHLTRVTKEPVYIDPDLSALCAAAAPAATTTRTGAARYGPHDQTVATIYMNASAADAFAARPAAKYPVGSVIVKEKKSVGPAGHDGVEGMVKRPAGYDPPHGDWEYFYFQGPAATAKIDSGKIATCVRCHAGAANKDYVFGDWAHDATAQ
jgi:hypothetical protein